MNEDKHIIPSGLCAINYGNETPTEIGKFNNEFVNPFIFNPYRDC